MHASTRILLHYDHAAAAAYCSDEQSGFANGLRDSGYSADWLYINIDRMHCSFAKLYK